MGANQPFFRGPNRTDAFTGATVLAQVNQLNPGAALLAWSGVEAGGSISTYSGVSIVPPIAIIISPSFVVIGVEGTQNSTQTILELVGSVQAPVPGIPGSVGVYWGGAAVAIWAAISGLVVPYLAGRSVVLIGHSLGGAIVQCLEPLILAAATVPVSVWTYGCPRVGDPVFAAAVSSTVIRYEDTDDPIVSIPPVLWAGPGSNFPYTGPPPLATYVHAGQGYTLDAQGVLTDGSTPMNLLAAAAQLATGSVPTHYVTEYVRRLAVGLTPADLSPPESGYVDPVILEDLFSEIFPLGGVSMSAFSKVDVNYHYGESGITESFWSNSPPNTITNTVLPAYLNARFAFAVSTLSFNYARISNTANPRQVDFATPDTPGIPKQGILGASIKAGAIVPSSDTDALLLRMKLTGGPSARIFVHGFDASMISEGHFTPNATFTAALNSFLLLVSTAGNNIYYEFGTPVPISGRLAITAIAKNSPRGATITPAVATTAAPGNTVYIGGTGNSIVGIRGRKVIQSVAAGGASFNVGGAQPQGTYGGTGGFYYVVQPNYQTVNYGYIERLTEHHVGRPFGAPRGRRSNTLALRL